MQHWNVYNHISYLTKEQSERLFANHPELYMQAAMIADNFGIVPQQVTVNHWLSVGYTIATQEDQKEYEKGEYAFSCEPELAGSTLYPRRL